MSAARSTGRSRRVQRFRHGSAGSVGMGTLVWLLLVLALVVAVAAHGRLWRMPDRHNPWATLQVAEAPNWLTRHKLRRLDAQPQMCRDVLAATPLQAQPVPDRSTGSNCGFDNAVRLQRAGADLRLDGAVVLSCRAAVSLALWERHVVQPTAARLLGVQPQQLLHFGSYACRNVAGSEGTTGQGRRSQHATADALDVAGFVLPGGKRITVARDWQGDGNAALFLRTVHDGACPFFDGVLGPAYNAAHADHLHLDRGPYRICR